MATRLRVTPTATPTQNAQWQKIFPRNATKNYVNSMAFMRSLTTIALSTITYVQNILPDDSFSTVKLGGMDLQVIKENNECPRTKFISSALNSVLEAFDKQYLRKLEFVLYEDEMKPETRLESYVLKFNYKNNGADIQLETDQMSQMFNTTLDDIKETTYNLLMKIVMMCESADYKRPEKFDMTFYCYYYDKVTPLDYVPRGFKVDNCDDEFDDHDMTVLGDVTTPYHRLAVKFVKDAKETVQDKVEFDTVVHSAANSSFQSPASGHNSVSAQASFNSFSSAAELRCPCLVNNVDSPLQATWIQCTECRTMQHMACFGILSEENKPDRHVCEICAKDDDTLVCTDPDLVDKTTNEKKRGCLYRLALSWCSRVPYVQYRILKDGLELDDRMTGSLLQRLENDQIIYPLKTRATHQSQVDRKINKVGLKQCIPKHFNDTPVGISQLSHHLQQRVILTPEEITKLGLDNLNEPRQNIVNVTKVIETPKVSGNKFREAMNCTFDERMEDELPLSGSHNPVKESDIHKGEKRKADVLNVPGQPKRRRSRSTKYDE